MERQPPTDGAPFDERAWSEFLARELRGGVRVVFTRARATPVALRVLRGRPAAYEARLHAMFARCPAEVRAALVSWLRSGRRAPRAGRLLDDWIQAQLAASPAPAPPTRASDLRGAAHDLVALAQAVRARHLLDGFPDAAALPQVRWGRRSPSRSRHTLRLGSYDPDRRVVRLHPVLDQPLVPDWFVAFVLHHELLHALMPPSRGADRWVHHGAQFRRRERAHPDWRRALAWERRHLPALIRSARRGTPFEPAAPARARRGAVRAACGFLQGLLFPQA